MKYELIQGYTSQEFRSVTGVTPETFSAMLEQVRKAYSNAHRRRGRHSKLSPEDMLLMTLEYYKEYRTLECIGASYGLRKTNVGKVIKWVEEVLIRSGQFSLPGKKKLLRSDSEIEVIVVDTTETPIQRPHNNQRQYYSDKKTTYREVSGRYRPWYGTEQIVCTKLFNGNAHDGTIFKQTTRVHPAILVLADSGYRGIHKVHENTLLPVRHKEDIAKLSEDEKLARKTGNRLISSVRMKVEHIIGRIKNFKIMAEKYRGRRKRLLMRFNLICGIVNFQKQ